MHGLMIILLNQYCSGDKIEKNEMSGACSACERRGIYRVFVGKPEGKRPFGGSRRRWKDNIKLDLQKVVCGASSIQFIPPHPNS
jgi:hypothetical protein